jgi:hypothetical protein
MNKNNIILKDDQYMETNIFHNNEILNDTFFNNYNFIRIGVMGDNSCFYHCICFILNLYNYREKDEKEKREIIKKIRYFMYINMINNKKLYNNLSNSNISEFIKYDKFCYKLLNYNEWFDVYLYEYVCNYFNINIYIIHSDNINKFYTFDNNNNNLYYKNDRKNIILYNIDNIHYEIIGLKNKNTIKFIFNNNFIDILKN